MADRLLRILQVSPDDGPGGGHVVPWDLFRSFRSRGHGSWLAVGHKRSNDSDVLVIPRPELQRTWCRFWLPVSAYLGSFGGRIRGAGRLAHLLKRVAEPGRWLSHQRGIEDFCFPGSWQLLSLCPTVPDVVNFHNLHGGYFDLRVVQWLSQQLPVVLTLHDAWLLSGHCSHSFDCDRWRFGCGQCPDLSIYPAVCRDATAQNWRRKRDIFAKSRLYVATPSRWLMQKVEQSILAPAIKQARVIPGGIDLNVFCPAPKDEARAALMLPQYADLILFTANGIRRNIFKDYQTMRRAIARLGRRSTRRPLLFVALGEDGPAERIGHAEVRFVPYQEDRTIVARYYQAADVYLHAARVDTFPNSILEALACGTPVVATAVGGIPEQVKGLSFAGSPPAAVSTSTYAADKATGILTAAGDSEAIATGIEQLLDDASLRVRLGKNAAKEAEKRFDLNREVDDYLQWYQELLRKATCEGAMELGTS